MVKKYLDGKGIKYNVVNLDEQPEKQKEIYEKSGALTVPVTLIEKEDSPLFNNLSMREQVSFARTKELTLKSSIAIRKGK